MPTLQDLITRMKDIKSDIERSLPDIATSISLTAKALAERTIKEKGFGAIYSTTPLPAYFFEGKESTNRGRSFIENAMKKDEGIYWAEIRQAEGLQIEHVDLTFTGEMFAGMYPGDPEVDGSIVIAPLGHTNKEGQKKMNWNKERYGDFIGKALKGNNYELLVKVATEETIRILERNNL